MNRYSNARLVTLSGADRKRQLIMNRGYMTVKDAEQFPELMGVIPLVAEIAAAVPTLVKGVGSLFGWFDDDDDESAVTELYRQQLLAEQQRREQTTKILMVAIPAAVVGIILLTRGGGKK